MSNLATAEKLIEPAARLAIPPPFLKDSKSFVVPEISRLPTDLPVDDGEPLETNQHRITMNALIQSLKHAWADRSDFFVGGNMFVYFSPHQKKDKYKGPDFFVALDVDGSYSRQSWVVWEEGWKYPDVIVELLSSSTRGEDLGNKKTLYEQKFQTSDYFVFDPLDANSLQGWTLKNKRYKELLPNKHGRLWSDKLGLWLGVWKGAVEKESGKWLRFYDTRGRLVPLPDEAAEKKAQSAEKKAQSAEKKAQSAEKKAEKAIQQVELEREQRKLAELRAAQLAAKLYALGFDPEKLT